MDTYVSNDKVFCALKGIFNDLFGINVNEGSGDEQLLSKDMKLLSSDLVYLFFEIEKRFNIIIPKEDIVSGRFSTFNNIAAIVREQLESITDSKSAAV